MKTRELARARIGKVTPPAFEHINRQIPPEPHTAMYVWHKYWSRKTWNVVGEHIKAYTKPLGQVSAKAMMQPFGSAQGDFYLRFVKTIRPARPMEEVSEERFRRIVIDTCREVIAIRAEPTPYTILINQVDPVVAKRGLFGTLHTGLDVKTVLEESVGKEFELVEAKLGGAEGKLCWFADKAWPPNWRRCRSQSGSRKQFSAVSMSTTTMTSGLQRGSNLPASVPKTVVIPEEREKDVERKMKSPLFSEHCRDRAQRTRPTPPRPPHAFTLMSTDSIAEWPDFWNGRGIG